MKRTNLFFAPASLLFCGIIQAQPSAKPNLVFIMADQWRGQAFGCENIEPVHTPNIDQLAKGGVLFSNAVSSYPVSSPARAMLMTGMYPVSNGVTGNCNSQTAPCGIELSQSAVCWSDVLKSKGYSLGYIGKWHLDAPQLPYVDTYNNRGAIAWNEWCPPNRRHGFDYWLAYGTYDNHLKPMYWDDNAKRNNFFYVDQWGPEYEADKAIAFINNKDQSRHGNTPFALVVSMNPPHTGYNLVPQKYKDMYQTLDVEKLCNRPNIPPRGTHWGDYYRKNIKDYYACMTGVDEQVGRIVNALKQKGMFENTIIVFTSDHGDCLGIHEQSSKNNFYEESMRIPMVISWREKIKPRKDDHLMIAFADLYPTLLSLMGFGNDIPKEVETKDLSEFVLQPAKKTDISQPYYFFEPCDNYSGLRGLRTGRYTFVVKAEKGEFKEYFLFDRKKDPYQMENMAAKEPGKVKELSEQLIIHLRKTGDPFVACIEKYPVPSANQLKWHEAELGVVFHYDLHVFDDKKYSQAYNRIHPVENYNIFNPLHLDTDQWVKAAKDAGARFAVLTATHETGFALYQSDINPYCMKALKWKDGKGDIVRDFVNSCRKHGIQPGIYIGIRWNSLLGIHNFKAEGEGAFAQNRQLWYKRMCEGMVEELCSRYGELFMVWFDGGADDPRGDGPNVLPIVTRLQPRCLFYHNIDRADFRWGGSETGTVGYPCWSSFPYPYSHNKNQDTAKDHQTLLKHGAPARKYWVPAMADAPLRGANGRHEWFWEPGDENAIEPLSSLVNMYYKSVGRNATLILGLTPDSSGLMPVPDVKRLQEFGDYIRETFGHPAYSTSGNGTELTIELRQKQKIEQCIIQEEITKGERIRKYRIVGKKGNKWIGICSGESVGYKRIEKFEPVEISAIKIIVDEYIDTPSIKNFCIFEQN